MPFSIRPYRRVPKGMPLKLTVLFLIGLVFLTHVAHGADTDIRQSFPPLPTGQGGA